MSFTNRLLPIISILSVISIFSILLIPLILLILLGLPILPILLLLSTLMRASTPTKSAIVLDPHDDKKLRKALIPLMIDVLPDWNDGNDENIEIEKVSGALTNFVFFVTKRLQNKEFLRVVLKIDGDGINEFLNRQRELDFVQKLSMLNIGPRLLALFGNGRIEEYLHAVTLKREDIPSASAEIAEKLCELHNIVNIFPPSNNKQEPEVWANINRWYPLAEKVVEERREEMERIFGFGSFEELPFEIEELQMKLSCLNSPIVFAHDDAQYGNVLRLADGSNRLVLVDYEYSGFNYQAFDFANFFCEWMFNYHEQCPHDMHEDWYPNEDEQEIFFKSYINSGGRNDTNLQRLKLDTEAFTLASDVMWGLWGLAKSKHVIAEPGEFDYFIYGIQRLKHFRRRKSHIYELLNENNIF